MITSVIDKDLWTSLNNNFKDYSKSYDGALGFNLVKIRPNLDVWPSASRDDIKEIDKTITGIMINEFTYSMDSEWSTMETPIDSGLGTIVGGIATMGGGGEMGYVYKSKKYWKKSGYLKANPEIRIIDIDGTGLPLEVARILLRWTVANSRGNKDGFAEKIEKNFTELYNTLITKNVKKVENVQKEDNNTAFAEALMSGASTTVKAGKNFIEDISDLFSLRQSPPPLQVDIGRVFSHKDMVLENVSFKFSRESTDNGPLYVDATLELCTRKMIGSLDDIGLVNKVGRVTIGNN